MTIALLCIVLLLGLVVGWLCYRVSELRARDLVSQFGYDEGQVIDGIRARRQDAEEQMRRMTNQTPWQQ
ncbi:hypothetical protein [Pseudofrankia sp. DC12]|uniref:hypothetical protein n=1 Tax=Pseudofrankia sp. DC12 TaxID=683315 RepID=UPI0005F7DD4A|nr:hypothetical protein [Pseudofrankia sp. DC12]